MTPPEQTIHALVGQKLDEIIAVAATLLADEMTYLAASPRCPTCRHLEPLHHPGPDSMRTPYCTLPHCHCENGAMP